MGDSVEYVDDLAIDYQNSNLNIKINRDTGQEYAVVTRRRVSNQITRAPFNGDSNNLDVNGESV